jgi:hypothetical protein
VAPITLVGRTALSVDTNTTDSSCASMAGLSFKVSKEGNQPAGQGHQNSGQWRRVLIFTKRSQFLSRLDARER